ncbi:MAG: (Fe-S)-binding protein, partial [Vicinamibacterales bacterium]|nr:(Fe-S)-binding protein [Vicinamibacterales bacterium]
EEDPRIAEVASQLPNANCGACGLAGCQDFAVKVVAGEVVVTGCPVGGQDVAAEIARILGVEPGESVRLVARVHCRGGAGIAAVKADYAGPATCSAAALVAGGPRACLYGCLSGGECVAACQFDAMFLDEQRLPHVIEELCTGCGACARACPRHIIELHPEDREVFVFCRNHDDPKTAKKVCAVACLGCGICSKKSNGAVTLQEHLAVIDYERLDPALIPFDKCRPGAISRLHQPPAQPSAPGAGAGA